MQCIALTPHTHLKYIPNSNPNLSFSISGSKTSSIAAALALELGNTNCQTFHFLTFGLDILSMYMIQVMTLAVKGEIEFQNEEWGLRRGMKMKMT